ncbi:MAG: RNA polymerase sigma factor [Parcubacteria group bacterium]
MRIQQLTQFEDLVKNYQKNIINFHYRLVGNRFEAEDLAQDTFIKAYKKFDSVKDKKKVKSWLFSIARNVTVDFFRRKKEKTITLDNTMLENYARENAIDYQAQVINTEISKELQSCIEQLQPEDRTIIKLLYYEGFSYKEIATMMNMNQNTLKSKLHRARQSLQELIKANNLLQDVATMYT